jgi:hypothetical protein
MFDWLKTMVKPPEPAGPPEVVRRFGVEDATINTDAVSVEGDAFRVRAVEATSVRLFEIEDPAVENCLLTYRAWMKTAGLTGRAYLEMWCRFPGRGEFFSKGFDHAVKGDNDWASYEIPFYLKKGQRPDLIKLNIAVEGSGDLWLKDIELQSAPFE